MPTRWGADHPLAPLLPLLVREADAARLILRPLDGGAVRAFVAGRYALPEAEVAALTGHLVERSEGNPLFMTELLHALEEEGVLRRTAGAWELGALPQRGVPPLLRQVIEARVGRLGDEGRELLAVAAVIGQEVPLALWQQVSGADEGTLLGLIERSVAARVVEETADGAGVTFAHALIRAALYEGMAATRRRVWHRTIGEALARARPPDPDAVGYHLGAAGDERAVEWLIRAGDRASRAFAYQTATARFTDALALIGHDPDRAVTRCELLIRLARLLRITDPGQAILYEEEALQLATEAKRRGAASGGPIPPRLPAQLRRAAAARPRAPTGGARDVGCAATGRDGAHRPARVHLRRFHQSARLGRAAARPGRAHSGG